MRIPRRDLIAYRRPVTDAEIDKEVRRRGVQVDLDERNVTGGRAGKPVEGGPG